MKRIASILFISFCTIMIFAQDKGISPVFGIEIDREVAFAVIEEKTYENVTVELKSADIASLVSGVKVIVRDTKSGKRIYKKRFSKSYLYVYWNEYSNTEFIQVGKGDALIQVIVSKPSQNDELLMRIREKGIY